MHRATSPSQQVRYQNTIPVLQSPGMTYGVVRLFSFLPLAPLHLLLWSYFKKNINCNLYSDSLNLIQGNVIAATIIKLRCANA